MKTYRVLRGGWAPAIAMTLLLDCPAQEPPAKAAIPIKELTPPPPKQTDGKHLIAPRPAQTTGSVAVVPAEEAKWTFESRDTNKDGKLSREEVPERMRPGFKVADGNKDGFIALEEQMVYLGLVAGGATPFARLPASPMGVLAFRDVPYAETDNPRQRLDLYLPRDPRSDKPLPVVVFIHGGGWRKGDKSAGTPQVMPYVKSGQYAAVTLGYRLTDEEPWPAQIHDCKAAIRWLKANASEYFLDPNKIGVWGASAGGHLASMVGLTGDVKALEGTLGKHLDQDSRVACVVNYFGPANFLTMIHQPSSVDRKTARDYPEALLLGGPVPEQEALAKEASPVTHVSAGDPPFFTAHGTKDLLVPFAQAQELHAALTKANVPSLLQEMTNGGHGFRSNDLDQRVRDFLDLHLRERGDTVNATPIVFPEKSSDKGGNR